MNIKGNMSVLELVEEMGRSGVLGAGKMYRATKLMADVMKDEDTKVFLSVAGPLVPGGLKNVIRDLINDGLVNALFTSGANLTHDMLEAFGGGHYRGIHEDDETMCSHGMGRIADLYTKSQDFEVFEKRITQIFSEISQEKKNFTIREFLTAIGNSIDDEKSILHTAAKKGVPIYAPGIIDSMIGLQLFMFTQDHELHLDAPGGLPKHYALASNLLKGGVDAGIQITMDRGETGSLSGAPLEEAKSWAKAKAGSKLVTVIGDVTIIFPTMVAAVREIIDKP